VQAIGLFFAFLKFFFGAANILSWSVPGSGVGFDSYSSSVMYLTFLSTNSTEMFSFKDLNYPKKALVVSSFIVGIFQAVIQAYTTVLNFLAALAIFDITNTVYKFVFSHDEMNIRSLLDIFHQMCTEVKRINAFNSRVTLVVYVLALSWFSCTSVDVMEEYDWVLKVFLVSEYLVYALTFVVAAEANKKASL